MPQDNRILIAIGAGIAIIAAVVIALLLNGGRDEPATPPPAAQGGLTIDVADAPGLDSERELRCFVNGQFVGMANLADCARQNGLATEAMDVGIDQSGQAAAFVPPVGPPPVEDIPVVEIEPYPEDMPEPTRPTSQPTRAGSACLRHTGSDWRSLSNNMSLEACVQALYSGTCVRPGDAQYGRWGDTTVRLVAGRVEQSADNSRFSTLVQQDRSCQFPELR
ncbi:MAG: hypothetical protein JHC81_12670 [Brevundimonas sp.]|uniref:hypothetical protein n=1 Tax=Brevundimonas sp. TaxID=1871086 RepID=UPI001A2CC52C|nr:hypothetical protein [Brevundimonas sp.]MBJ7448379.1 hypothetical protein [Brevundimonas sp.]